MGNCNTEENPTDSSSSAHKPLKIGLVCIADPGDPNLNSGMPFSLLTAFKGQGTEVVSFYPKYNAGRLAQLRKLVGGLMQPIKQNKVLQRVRASRANQREQQTDHYLAEVTFDAYIERSRVLSLNINRQIAHSENLDAILCLSVSSTLSAIETEVPIFYMSDATAELMLKSYSRYSNGSSGFRQACELMEARAMGRVHAAMFPSRTSLNSAINAHGLPEGRAFLVSYGANVRPPDGLRLAIDAPSRENLQLLLVAADPVRKRLDFCVQIVEELNRQGVKAELNSIGPATNKALNSPHVNCLGRLELNNSQDRIKHQLAVGRSHLGLLPSTGEMLGISPMESAHFGRPSIVSDVGGLPSVVKHNKTGLVLPISSSVEDYARELVHLVDDKERYLLMSNKALEAAQRYFTWDACAESVLGIIRSTLSE